MSNGALALSDGSSWQGYEDEYAHSKCGMHISMWLCRRLLLPGCSLLFTLEIHVRRRDSVDDGRLLR